MFDYVIVGAGSSGCALAARLAINPRTRVLLLEAGGPDTRREIQIPAAFPNLFKTEVDWAYETEPQPTLAGRRLFWPRGKVLGGSGTINAMIYIRGHRSDYDHWAALGNTGWTWNDVLPLFRRSECNSRGASEFHGAHGPLHVEDLPSPNVLSRAFVDACVEIGIPRNSDFNGAQQEGAGFYQVTQRRGRRESAATAYLQSAAKGRANLGVRPGAHVTRILFDKQQAIGVEYFHEGATRVASCTREVILCGGAVNSPQLLLLSGIGPPAELGALGIEVVADVPGVGKNLQDHLVAGVHYVCKTHDSYDQAETLWNFLRYQLTRSGPFRSNVAEAGAFVRTSSALDVPNVQYHFAPAYFLNHGFDRPDGHGFTLGALQLRPRSRGEITLRTADPLSPPAIQPNYLSDPEDLRVLLAGVRLARKIAAAHAFDAFRGAERFPGFAAESDEALIAHIASTSETLYHPVGMCKMGPFTGAQADPMAVVDPELRVRGVTGLRVADASIMPTLIGGNTNAAAILIAERAADVLS
jgi:choline dehydrogenase